MNMKKIYYLIFAVVLAAFASCQKPQYIEPTADRQGITSLTAYFTTGKYVDQQIAKLDVTDENTDYYLIEIPWFFPEDTEDPTTIYMSSLRIRAELAPNCKIDPPLTILDLNQENRFTFTNNKGESRPIVITGKRTKSRKCNLMTFALTDPYRIDGFINDETQEIYLFTVDDLSGFSAEATACAHATIMTELKVSKNYNNEQEVTVVAQDGETSCTYKVIKKYPSKIPYGIREGSVRQLFNFEPVSRLGFPEYTATVYPSLASIEGNLIVSLGDGTAPVCLDGLTGAKKGNINVGSLAVAAITNDEGGNLILSNYAEAHGICNLYRTKSASATPELFHTFENSTDVPVGFNLKVHGNIDTEAVIILTHEGIAGVTETSKYTRIVVSGGTVVSTETFDLAGLGLTWGAAPTNAAKIVPVSANPEDGIMLCYYSDNTITYVNGKGAIAAQLPLANLDVTTNYNTNVMEAKTYNNATFAIHLTTSHFPMWGIGPQLRVFDATTPTSIKEGAPVIADTAIEWFQTAAAGCAAADVVMASSADGFKAYIYYFDHNAGVIGGYVADCIDM